MINPNFVILGVLLQFAGGVSYFIDTLKGKAKPNRVSWILWALAPFIAFAAQIKQGVGIQALATFIVGFVPLMVFIASFVNKKAQWKLTALDMVCGILAVLGLAAWLVTKVGNVAIFFAILADGLASVPTIIKAYHHPESENDLAYLGTVLNGGIALLTIKEWNFQTYAFPLYLTLTFLVVFLLIRFRLGKVISR